MTRLPFHGEAKKALKVAIMLFDLPLLFFLFTTLQTSPLAEFFLDVFNVGNWFRHEWWKISVWIFDEFHTIWNQERLNKRERTNEWRKLLRSTEFQLKVHCLSCTSKIWWTRNWTTEQGSKFHFICQRLPFAHLRSKPSMENFMSNILLHRLKYLFYWYFEYAVSNANLLYTFGGLFKAFVFIIPICKIPFTNPAKTNRFPAYAILFP